MRLRLLGLMTLSVVLDQAMVMRSSMDKVTNLNIPRQGHGCMKANRGRGRGDRGSSVMELRDAR